MIMIAHTKMMQIPYLDIWSMFLSRQMLYWMVMAHPGHDQSQNLIKICQVVTIYKIYIFRALYFGRN